MNVLHVEPMRLSNDGEASADGEEETTEAPLTRHRPLEAIFSSPSSLAGLEKLPGPPAVGGGATALWGYLRSDLRDQQPEILAPAPSSMSASYDNLLSSSVDVGGPAKGQATRVRTNWIQ